MTTPYGKPATVALFGALILHATGCAPGDVEAGAGSAETDAHAAANPAVWEAASPSGLPVTLTVDPYPVRVGDMSFHISFGQAVPDSIPVSIDIVSPEMPMMGIRRYAAERMANGDYMVAAPIMMDGLWAVYVNLGSGADAASFEFEAEPGEDGAARAHGAADGHDPQRGH